MTVRSTGRRRYRDRTDLAHFQGGDDDVGGADSDWDGGGVGFLDGDSFDVDNPFLSVDLTRASATVWARLTGEVDGSARRGSTDTVDEAAHLLTWMTFPSLPLYFPRTIVTSSSFLMGIVRHCSSVSRTNLEWTT